MATLLVDPRAVNSHQYAPYKRRVPQPNDLHASYAVKQPKIGRFTNCDVRLQAYRLAEAVSSSSMLHLHEAFHRDHVVVEVSHDPHRSNDQHEYNKNAERKRHYVVHAVGSGGNVNEEDDVNAHLRDRQYDQRGWNAGLPHQ